MVLVQSDLVDGLLCYTLSGAIAFLKGIVVVFKCFFVCLWGIFLPSSSDDIRYHKAAQLGVVCTPIPGTTKSAHAIENISACEVQLTDTEMTKLEQVAATVEGERGDERYMSSAFNTKL